MTDSRDSQQSWFDLVYAAPEMTAATMCLAATHYYQRGGGAEYLALAYRYNGRAIQAINKALNDPTTRFSDGLVSAVFTLAFSAVGLIFHSTSIIYPLQYSYNMAHMTLAPR